MQHPHSATPDRRDRARPLTRAEQESIVRWDADPDSPLWFYTADPVTARRWAKAGVPLAARPGGWHAEVSKGTLTVRVRARRILSAPERAVRRRRLGASAVRKLRDRPETGAPEHAIDHPRTLDTPRDA